MYNKLGSRMDKAHRDELIRLIASPPAGSKIAAAKDAGVDLTLLLRVLELTPTQRLQELADAEAFVREFQAVKEAAGRKQKAVTADARPRNGPGLILKILWDAEVRFVMVGDLAATVHGPVAVTHLLEVCYDRGRDNIERLAKSLKPFHPRLRGERDDLPFCFDAATIAHGMNFALTTDIGVIDLFGEMAGIGDYEHAKALSITRDLFDFQFAVLSLEGLIRCKRATACPKGILTLRHLEALREKAGT